MRQERDYQHAGADRRTAAHGGRRHQPPVVGRTTHTATARHQCHTRPARTAHHTTGLQQADTHPGHLPRHTDHGCGSRRGGGAGHRERPAAKDCRQRRREEESPQKSQGRTHRHTAHQAQSGRRPQPLLAHREHREKLDAARNLWHRQHLRQLVPPPGRGPARPPFPRHRHGTRRCDRGDGEQRIQGDDGGAVASRMA